MSLQKHKLSFMVNNVSRSSVRFPCSVNFLKAWCQKLAFFFGQIEIPAQLISSLLRKRYWFILAWSLGSKYSPLECSSALLERLVHELIPFFGSTRETKQNADFQWLQGVYFLEKCNSLSESVAIAQNWGILKTRMDQRWDNIKMNFDYFQIQKWMLQTVRAEKVDEKMKSFV